MQSELVLKTLDNLIETYILKSLQEIATKASTDF
jgi:uncharacterized protein YheU (UPF0270 family)